MSRVERARHRTLRNLRWLRTEGANKVAEEHDLRPIVRTRRSFAKARWRRQHPITLGSATPVFVFGAQRSGTNLLVRSLDDSPEFQVYNESNRKAFELYHLRSDPDVRRLVLRTQLPYVLFKPLCDSHRAVDLLDGLGTSTHPRAIWAYRDFEGRARSAVAKFGDSNLSVLREFAAGRSADHWQVQGLSDPHKLLVRSLPLGEFNAESGAALFWYLRNSLFFDLGLADRDDVLLLSYNHYLRAPDVTVSALSRFLGTAATLPRNRSVKPRPSTYRSAFELHPAILDLCTQLQLRLDDHATAQARRLA
jgi:hypothetical protein